MKLDTSAAPEIALLAGELDLAVQAVAAPVTVGHLAACLRLLVADPQSWWGLVRFDPQCPVRIPVTAPGLSCEAWLLVLPPGHGASRKPDQPDQPDQPGWSVACLVAGAMTEQTAHTSRPLEHGRTQVRGGHGPAAMVNTGNGYAVSLHARPSPQNKKLSPAHSHAE